MLRYDKTSHTINKSTYSVPNIVVAYNKYMNNVDLVDQRRRTSYTPRKERKIYMSFFHLMLDYAINNAYALYRWVYDNYNSTDNNDHRKKTKCVDLYDFKMQIGIDLCNLSTNTKKYCTDNLTDVGTNFIRINRKRKLTEMNCIPRRVDLSAILTYKRQAHTMHILRRFKLEPKYKENRSPRHKRYQCFLHGKFKKKEDKILCMAEHFAKYHCAQSVLVSTTG